MTSTLFQPACACAALAAIVCKNIAADPEGISEIRIGTVAGGHPEGSLEPEET